MLFFLVSASAAWQPSMLTARRPVPALMRSTVPQSGLLLPELSDIGPAQAIIPVFLVGPTIQIGYAIEVSIKKKLAVPLEGGFFYGIVRSDAVQKGPQMKKMKKEKPKVGGKRLTPEAAAIVASFRKEPTQKEVELLWGALLKVYGTSERALEAVQANPQILNPSYSFCNTIIESKRVLRTMMDEEEALEVMKLNPAVLQCGPSLEVLGSSEVKSIAMFRNMGNTVLPAPVRTGATAVFIFCILLAIVSAQADNPEALALVSLIKPVLGGGLASVLLFVLYGSANAQRSVKDAEAKQLARRGRAVWDK